ncbi:MAG TPA: hypothetical protein VIS03_13370 [Kiloniellaceae bacterium]
MNRTAIPEAFAESERGNAGAGASVAGRWWLPLAFASLAIASLAIAAPAAAQTVPEETTKLADQLIACAGLPGSEDRLKCYDRLAQPLLGLETEDSAPTAAHSFTGRDDWDSQPFEMTKAWRLVWQNQGSLLTVELRAEQGEMLDVIGNQIGQGGGRSEVQEPGVYRLAVRGLGGWRVQVVPE